MKPSKYSVKAQGHGSSYMPMEVTLSKDKIEDINVDASGETRGVADEVFNRLPKLIVDNQTLNIDAVSGAAGAGLAAVARSIQLGHKVVILEKFPQMGGNTSRAGGPMNAAEPE